MTMKYVHRTIRRARGNLAGRSLTRGRKRSATIHPLLSFKESISRRKFPVRKARPRRPHPAISHRFPTTVNLRGPLSNTDPTRSPTP